MDKPEAIDILRQVISQWRGTIAEGKLVEEAFVTLVSEPVPEEPSNEPS